MKKILIVDDNMDFLRILSSALQKRFQTYESMGVADALKILESVTVDAVCSDFNMRDGTGLELLIKLRQKGVKVPFLLMSGDDDTRLRNEAQACGAALCVFMVLFSMLLIVICIVYSLSDCTVRKLEKDGCL